MIAIGQVLKPQGIRGELKVRPLTSDPSRFCVLKSVYVGGKPYNVKSVRQTGNDVFLSLSGVEDRNAAELFRNALIEIDDSASVVLDDGEFFISDIVGCALYTDGEEPSFIGTVKRVDSFGAADVFTVQCEGGDMSFPFLKALDARLDAAQKRLYVNGNKLKEVAVYED